VSPLPQPETDDVDRSQAAGGAAPPSTTARVEARRRSLGLCVATLCLLPWGLAHGLQPPAGTVVLTISGRVGKPNAGDAAHFDMTMLEQLPQRSFTTSTPWYSEPRKFTGPLLRDVLAACGAQGSSLRAIALNDYQVDLPFDDVQRFDVLLARLLDDRPMSVRDKGPLFIIYPFDARPALRSTTYYGRSAWQLKRIEVR
jgi:hypothetical protein